MSTSRATDATPGTRPAGRTGPSAGPLMKVAMVVFAVGVIAIVVDLALFASGSRDLPLWLNLLCLLAPVGLGRRPAGHLLSRRAHGGSNPAAARLVLRPQPTGFRFG